MSYNHLYRNKVNYEDKDFQIGVYPAYSGGYPLSISGDIRSLSS